jgi:hypothetical protein
MGSIEIPEWLTWKVFSSALKRSSEMGEDLATVLEKPDSKDRQRDAAWRRLCAKWMITTKPDKVSADRTRYNHDYYLERRVQELQAELAALKDAAARKTFDAARASVHGRQKDAECENRRAFIVLIRTLSLEDRKRFRSWLRSKKIPASKCVNILRTILDGLAASRE